LSRSGGLLRRADGDGLGWNAAGEREGEQERGGRETESCSKRSRPAWLDSQMGREASCKKLQKPLKHKEL
ncbi:MAG: hypothetical protein WBE72_09680, partial [Terracidiphilus sp.]